MNIIHKTTQKFVPNLLFKQTFHGQINDYQNYSKQNKQKNSKQKSQNIKKQSIKKKCHIFNDRSNINFNKQFKTNEIEEKINQFKFTQDFKSSQNQKQNTNQYLSNQSQQSNKIKNKKTNSPKKNLTKLLLNDFDQNTSQQESNNVNSKNLQNEKKKEFKIQNQEKIGQLNKHQHLKKQLKVKKRIKQKQQQQNINQEKEKDEIVFKNEQYNNKQKSPSSKMNKFNLLYNDMNFDSSDSQNSCNDQKRSSGSDNQKQKIMFLSFKNRNKDHIFLGQNQFDDSEQSEEAAKTNIQDQQLSNNMSNLNQQKFIDSSHSSHRSEQQKKLKSVMTYINTTQFRKNYIKEQYQFLKQPIPQNKYIQFILKRDKSKKKSNYVEYYLYDSKIIKQILHIKKKSLYQIYAKQNVQKPKAHPDLQYLTATLDNNFLGNYYSLKYIDKKTNQKTLAQNITYQTNILGLNGPRKINVYLPEQKVFFNQNNNLQSLYHKQSSPFKIHKFVNKQAKWNNQVQSYVLNMKGKAKLSSVKNFVIVKCNQNQKIISQEENNYVIFGKVDRDIFNLVIGGPYSILQGLSVALSTFQSKFACQ